MKGGRAILLMNILVQNWASVLLTWRWTTTRVLVLNMRVFVKVGERMSNTERESPQTAHRPPCRCRPTHARLECENIKAWPAVVGLAPPPDCTWTGYLDHVQLFYSHAIVGYYDLNIWNIVEAGRLFSSVDNKLLLLFELGLCVLDKLFGITWFQ